MPGRTFERLSGSYAVRTWLSLEVEFSFLRVAWEAERSPKLLLHPLIPTWLWRFLQLLKVPVLLQERLKYVEWLTHFGGSQLVYSALPSRQLRLNRDRLLVARLPGLGGSQHDPPQTHRDSTVLRTQWFIATAARDQLAVQIQSLICTETSKIGLM